MILLGLMDYCHLAKESEKHAWILMWFFSRDRGMIKRNELWKNMSPVSGELLRGADFAGNRAAKVG